MPTVLRQNGFDVRLRLPPREHPPPHVHVYKAGGVVIVDIPAGDEMPGVRDVEYMRDVDVSAAARIVWEHRRHLHALWRMYHGKT